MISSASDFGPGEQTLMTYSVKWPRDSNSGSQYAWISWDSINRQQGTSLDRR